MDTSTSYLEEMNSPLNSLSSQNTGQFGLELPNEMLPNSAKSHYTPVGMNHLTQGLQLAQEALSEFAGGENAIAQLQTPFGTNFDTIIAQETLQDFSTGDFSELPNITLKAASELNGADGAYDSLTGEIFVSSEFAANNAAEAVSSIILEELGHHLDTQINSSDSPGDEGEIFANLVQGQTMTDSTLTALQTEDDTTVISLGEQDSIVETSDRPDLYLNYKFASRSASAGGKVTVAGRVRNSGRATAGSSYLKYYLSNDTRLSSNDLYLGRDYVKSLPRYNMSFEYETLVIPTQAKVGNQYILFQADAYNQVSESNEYNNISYQAINITSANSKPDLVVQNDAAPSSAKAGQTIRLTSRVKNAGDATAGSSYLKYYLSNDTRLSSDDKYLSADYVGNLSSGSSSYEYQNVTIPTNAKTGWNYILFAADANKQVSESNESNNVAYEAIYLTGGKPDLVVQNDAAPSSAKAGQTIRLTSRVKNAGDATAGSSYLKYYLSNDTRLSSDDKYLSADYVGNLSSGSSSYEYQNVTIPTNAKTGWNYILFAADANKQVSESNESNNVAYEAIYLTGGKPDLVVQNDAAPSSAKAGQTIRLTSRVKNAGDATAGSSYLKYYLSNDTRLSSDDKYLSADYVGNLSSGSSSYEYQNVTIPTNAKTGWNYILFAADANKQVSESNESNNVAYEAIYLTGGKPDLVVQNDAAPSSAKAGQTIRLTSRVKNAGDATAGSSYLKYYLSNDTRLSSDDKYLDYDWVSSLSSGSSSYESEYVTIPTTAKAGWNYILFAADANKRVSESNESNNVAYEAINITGGGWKAEYFNNTNLSGSPVWVENFGSSDKGFTKNWGSGGPISTLKDNFSARMTTERSLAPGLYKITTKADDGIRVKINNKTVVNRWVNQPFVTNSGFYRSNGGTVPITVEYFERAGSAALDFDLKPVQKFIDSVNAKNQWNATVFHWDSSKASKPPSNFWSGDINNNANAIGVINLGSHNRSDGKKGINFDWGTDAPKKDGARLPHDNFAIRAYTHASFDGGNYKFRVRGDDGFQLLAKQHGTGKWFYITPQNSWQQAYGSHKEITYKLPSGNYDLHFHMYEGGGNAYFDLSWDKVGSSVGGNPNYIYKDADYLGALYQDNNSNGFSRKVHWSDSAGRYTSAFDSDDSAPNGKDHDNRLYALVGGEVIEAKNGKEVSSKYWGYNGTVAIYNKELNKTFIYWHLAQGSINESLQGKTIAAGSLIGKEGNTGSSYGNHTHVEIHQGRAYVDMSNPSAPKSPANSGRLDVASVFQEAVRKGLVKLYR